MKTKTKVDADSEFPKTSKKKVKKQKAKTKESAAGTITALSKAREFYAKQGDANSNGDWLAVALKDAFHTEDGDFDLDSFKKCLKENKIEPPKVDESKPGWRGRFRMCGGLMLRSAAKKKGHIVIDGEKVTPR
jgi:hypothetical protein